MIGIALSKPSSVKALAVPEAEEDNPMEEDMSGRGEAELVSNIPGSLEMRESIAALKSFMRILEACSLVKISPLPKSGERINPRMSEQVNTWMTGIPKIGKFVHTGGMTPISIVAYTS